MKYKGLIATNLLTGIVASVGTLMLSAQTGTIIDTLAQSHGNKTTTFYHLLILFCALIAITCLMQYLSQHFANVLAYKVGDDMRLKASEHLNMSALSELKKHSTGDTAQLLTNDIENISTAVAQLTQQLCYGIPMIIAALYFMARYSIPLMVVVLITTPLIFIFMLIVNKLSHRYFTQQQALLGELSTITEEYIPNETLVQFFNQEELIQQRFDNVNKELQHVGRKAQWIASLTNPLSRFVDHLTYLGIALVGGLIFIAPAEHYKVGILSSFILYAGQFSKPFIELSGLSTQLQTARASIDRFKNWLHHQGELEALPSEYPALQGDIQFENVTFGYDPYTPFIHDLSFTVKEGETVAIIGKTGAGKSTLIQLLLRFYDPQQGRIMIDHHNIQDLPKEQVRTSFGVVLQDPWLFKGTLRDNLCLAKAVSDDTIESILKTIDLWHWIERLPQGLDTQIDNDSFSEGERQLITIARTLIEDPHMIILDEATSAIDRMTEKKMMQAIDHLLHKRSAIVIAHRLETIQKADHIMVMEHGRCVEFGTPAELMAQQGAYYDFYMQQQEQ